MSPSGTLIWLWLLSCLSISNCYLSCTQVLVPPDGDTLKWPSEGHYKRNSNKCWVIFNDNPSPGDRITVSITKVDIDDSNASGCLGDVLQIRDHDSDGPELARVCGYRSCGHVTSSRSNQIYMRFSSNAHFEDEGFSAKFQVSNSSHSQYGDTSWQKGRCGAAGPVGGRSVSVGGLMAFIVIVKFTVGAMG